MVTNVGRYVASKGAQLAKGVDAHVQATPARADLGERYSAASMIPTAAAAAAPSAPTLARELRWLAISAAVMAAPPAVAPSAEVRNAWAFRFNAPATERLGAQWACFVGSTEQFLCDMHGIPLVSRTPYEGRAHGAKVAEHVQRTRQASYSPPVRGAWATWWGATANMLLTVQRARVRGNARHQEGEAMAAFRAHVGVRPENGAAEFKGFDPAAWERRARHLHQIGPPGLQVLTAEATRHAERARVGAIHAARAQFASWVADSAKKASGAVFGLLRPPRPAVADSVLLREPSEVMAEKRSFWKALWCPRGVSPDHTELFRRIRASLDVADPSELPRLTLDDLDQTLTTYPRYVGQGVDCLGPCDLRALPVLGKLQALEFLHECEAESAWPWQLLGVPIVLKPKDSGGDRALGLIPYVLRLWGRMRGGPTRDLNLPGRAGHWDSAIKGSSALQAAMRRAALAEGVALQECCEHVGAYLDVEKFYASSQPWL